MNFSQKLSKISFYGCWIMILLISGIYVLSTAGPRKNKILNTIEVPEVDPLIYLDTHFYVLHQYMYNRNRKDVPANEYLIEKSKNFYSGVTSSAYYNVFYRPDFEQYPVQTGLILFFRIATFLCLITSLFLLSKIFKSVYVGKPFNPKNQQRVIYIGFVFLILPVLRTLHSTVLAAFVRLDPKLLGYDVSPSYQSMWFVLFGLLIILGAFIYKELIRLHQEQKLTV